MICHFARNLIRLRATEVEGTHTKICHRRHSHIKMKYFSVLTIVSLWSLPPPPSPADFISADNDVPCTKKVRGGVSPQLLEPAGADYLLPYSVRAEAGCPRRAESSQMPSTNDDDDDEEEERRKRFSMAKKLSRASKAKRAQASRKEEEEVKSAFQEYLPMTRTAISSGSVAGGSSEVVEWFGTERAQAQLDYARSCAAIITAELAEMRQERYTAIHQKLLEERKADVPDDRFIKQLERNLASCLEAMQKAN